MPRGYRRRFQSGPINSCQVKGVLERQGDTEEPVSKLLERKPKQTHFFMDIHVQVEQLAQGPMDRQQCSEKRVKL